MRKALILVLLVLVVLPGWSAFAAPPQQQVQPGAPAITSYTTTATLVDRTQLAQRTARIPVSWATANRPSTANLVFEQVLPDNRVVNVELPRDNPWVASSGNGVVAPFPPGGNATQINLRVRLIDLLTQNTLAQRDLTLPIGDAPVAKPTITSFTSTSTTVSASALQNRTARIPVSWAVQNRPNTANLVFEQVLADNTAVNVELPRQNPYVASSGNGVVAPVPPGGTNPTSIKIRVRLIDLQSQTTLDQRELTINIDNTPGPTPTITTFALGATTVTSQALQARTARIPVSWAVENRPENSNLVFEQVLSDNRVVNVELPRQNPFVASSGNGVVAPIPPGGDAKQITLRVRLIDIRSSNVYATKEATVQVVDASQPAIITFSTSAQSVDRNSLTNRTARVPVTWEVINRPNTANLVFEQVLDDNSVVNVELPRDNPYVASSGTGVTSPFAPKNASTNTITLRLRLFDVANGTVYAERTLQLPITTQQTGNYIKSFTTTAASVDATGLQNRTARIPLAWEVQNRPAGTNLVFEQVLSDNRVVNVELPRQDPIVPSAGLGVVAPLAPGGNATSVKLQLRLVNLSNNATLDTKELTVPIAGGAVPTSSTGQGPQIVSFTANPNPASPGATITLSWQVTGATKVTLALKTETLEAAPPQESTALTGAAPYSIPQDATGTLTFVLTATDASNQSATQEVTVSIVGLPEATPEATAAPQPEATPEGTPAS
ncbi:MAG: hypothetical protein HZC41_11685 [Chloroflexi bacterium]|nr:hypothetical protein [Chloroflexota bacterium]